ncbi:DUF3093 domain-containing protein [Leucobacter sp. UT-8R-CII-1-4]|uniref:DUF3093 domain-containing protein n=1 Tax=Leucobacter sp. UT-8R-CII-1-4 TaxID=3040075 RepID=UPI0024A97924|nr:DUF3093 domain-containing protein [Leucobacter sp. UT-8R-CII-1-4]MDI6024309.1 DUF3093 domain-containing protein [Leucobacter sp. UT-8R-CII-1-4]
MSKLSSSNYRERLWPSPGLMIALLLLLPAVYMVITPIQASLAIPIAIGVYLLIAGSLVLMSPVVQISDGVFSAGSAKIPVSALGEVELLDDAGLRRAIGPGADARAYLLVRGFIHRGIRVEVTDEADPTPYWILTTRRPQQLAAAIKQANAAAKA